MPNDRIIVMMKRLSWLRVFTGYLNSVPLVTAWPQDVQFTASCSLKRLQYFYWDSALPASQELVASAMAATASPDDGGVSNAVLTLLNSVVGWPPSKVHIAGIPQSWIKWAYKIAKAVAAETEEADKLAEQFYSVLGAGGGLIGGTVASGVPSNALKGGTYGGYSIDTSQARMAVLIYNTAVTMGGSARDAAVGIEAAMTESQLTNLDYGTGGALGVFQQTPGDGWGTVAQILDPTHAARAFFQRLLAIGNRDSMTLWMEAQTVQRSSYSDGSNYQKYAAFATQVVASLSSDGAQSLSNSGGFSQLASQGKGGKASGYQLLQTATDLVDAHPSIPYQEGGDSAPNTPAGQITFLDCCLVAGTLISTSRGPVPIEEVGAGDSVYSWLNGSLTISPVAGMIERPRQDILKLRTRNRTVRASANHPFLKLTRSPGRRRDPVTGKIKPVDWRVAWTRLDQIERGDLIIVLDSLPSQNSKLVKDAKPLHSFVCYPNARKQGQRLKALGASRVLKDEFFRIERVLAVDSDGNEPTYDIEVLGTHNFIANGVVVHNSSFVQWSIFNTLGSLNGCPRVSQDQSAWCKSRGKIVSADQGMNIPGALMYIGQPGSAVHTEISLGDGKHTVGAHHTGTYAGVVNSQGYWTCAGLAPGFDYSGTPGTSPGAGGTTNTGVQLSPSNQQPWYNPNDPLDRLFGSAPWIPEVDTADMEEALAFTGVRSLLPDQPILPYLKNLVNSTLRAFSSAPNGDFIAWFPDYYGLWGTAAIMRIETVELQDFSVYWDDSTFVTHQYTVAPPAIGLDLATATVENLGPLLAFTTTGVATIDIPGIMYALFGLEPTPAQAQKFISFIYSRFGARPDFEQLPGVVGPQGEFMSALYLFMQNWAMQYQSDISLTFMPELWPGMLIQIPEYGFQAYTTTVTHSFQFGQGGYFNTTINIAAPARLPGRDGDSSGKLIGLPLSGGLIDQPGLPGKGRK